MREELQSQIVELTALHTGLRSVVERDCTTVIAGTLPFEASADGLETIADSFEIELEVPNAFPEDLPQARETGGRIDSYYEHRYPDGTLCLAVPVEQRRIFLESPTLIGFVNRLVIPYLYGYCFFKAHGRHPFGEAEHGYEGVLQHYVSALSLSSDLAALAFICFLLEHGYRGHHECPCGSGLKVRSCHGVALLTLHQSHNQRTVRGDFMAILSLCLAKYGCGMPSIPKPLRSQVIRLLKRFKD